MNLFQARALDIVDVFLAHQPRMSQALSLIMPLIGAMESAIKQKSHEPLQDRLKSTLKKLASLRKTKADEEDSDADKGKNLLAG